jgi:putative hydrolase of the HAD superfamily
LLTPNGIRAIFFDLDGTLRYNRPPSEHVFFDQAVRLGLHDSVTGRHQAYRWAHAYWANSDLLQEDQARYGEDQTRFWQNYAIRNLQAFGCSPAEAADLAPGIHRYMAEEYEPEDWIPDEVPETLARLQRAGFTLGVVSNRDDPFAAYLESIGLHKYVKFTLAAGEANSWKPDPGIFEHALKLGGTNPDETLYVGDNYYADVVGARRAGIHPVLIDPEGVFPPKIGCEVIRTLPEIDRLLT